MRNMWDHAIGLKKKYMLRKEKIYYLFSREREEVREFIQKQKRKRHI